MIKNYDLFKAFLDLYWLRPENATTSYFQSQTWQDINLGKFKNSLDIAGGDGCYIFLHLGGRFDERFDFFTKTNASKFKHSKFIDIYNVSSKKFSPKIKKKSRHQFNTVTDWKSGLLDKAKKLKIYKNFILHDNNVLPLPFNDEEYDFIHSNAVYWTSNSKDLLKDISRVAKKDGTLVMEVATNNILSGIKKNKLFLGKKLFDVLDRKRSVEMKMLKATHVDWTNWMKNAGFAIEDVRVAWPNSLISDSWDYGITRPISHLLIKMTEKLSDKNRVEIKREWTKIFFEILVPFCEKPKPFSLNKAPYITYILRKK